jgi:hypothetical protein
VVTLVLAAGFAVVGVAGAANAWDNTISGTVTCATGGGWTVTWRVVNSEPEAEKITASNRPAAVPVGTTLDESETRTFTETITSDSATTSARRAPSAKPTSDVTLTLSAEWDSGDTSTDSGTIPLSSFSDDCVVTTAPPPPVVTPPVVTPPVVAPPVVVPPEVLPAEVRVVTARARHIDKCGRTSDMYKVARRSGVVYRSGGKVLREGRWLKATHRTVTVRAEAADATFRLTGKSVWRMSFSNRPCEQAPEIAPDTGA